MTLPELARAGRCESRDAVRCMHCLHCKLTRVVCNIWVASNIDHQQVEHPTWWHPRFSLHDPPRSNATAAGILLVQIFLHMACTDMSSRTMCGFTSLLSSSQMASATSWFCNNVAFGMLISVNQRHLHQTYLGPCKSHPC